MNRATAVDGRLGPIPDAVVTRNACAVETQAASAVIIGLARLAVYASITHRATTVDRRLVTVAERVCTTHTFAAICTDLAEATGTVRVDNALFLAGAQGIDLLAALATAVEVCLVQIGAAIGTGLSRSLRPTQRRFGVTFLRCTVAVLEAAEPICAESNACDGWYSRVQIQVVIASRTASHVIAILQLALARTVPSSPSIRNSVLKCNAAWLCVAKCRTLSDTPVGIHTIPDTPHSGRAYNIAPEHTAALPVKVLWWRARYTAGGTAAIGTSLSAIAHSVAARGARFPIVRICAIGIQPNENIGSIVDRQHLGSVLPTEGGPTIEEVAFTNGRTVISE